MMETVSTSRCDVPADARAAVATRSWFVPLLLDIGVVLGFALIGRLSHGRDDLVVATVTTAAPFVIGLLAGWLRAPCAGMPTAQRARTMRFGWWVLATTMGGGILLRALVGDGLAPAFLLVTTGVLTLGLVGRRWLLLRWESWRSTR